MKQETRDKISKANKGKKLGPRSQETKDKISKTLSGRKRSQKCKDKLSKAMRKPKSTTSHTFVGQWLIQERGRGKHKKIIGYRDLYENGNGWAFYFTRQGSYVPLDKSFPKLMPSKPCGVWLFGSDGGIGSRKVCMHVEG